MNFIMSNGARSTQKGSSETIYECMFPKDTFNKIRSVTIFSQLGYGVLGFKFFDKNGTELWKHGAIYGED